MFFFVDKEKCVGKTQEALNALRKTLKSEERLPVTSASVAVALLNKNSAEALKILKNALEDEHLDGKNTHNNALYNVIF